MKAAADGRGVWFFNHLLSTNIVNLVQNMDGFGGCTYGLPDGILLSETGVVDCQG